MADARRRHLADERPRHLADERPRHLADERPRHLADERPRHLADERPRHLADERPRHLADERPRHLADERPWADQQTETCEECGFVPLDHDAADLPDAIRGLGRRYRMPLTRFLAGEDPDTIVRARPAPDRWSALEYACHARDVLSVFNGRVLLMVAEDRPSLGWWDHEAAAGDEAYNAQDPIEVADALDRNARTFAETLEAVPTAGWPREGVRRSGELFTVLGAGRFVLHEGHHHLLDIGRSLRAARGR